MRNLKNSVSCIVLAGWVCTSCTIAYSQDETSCEGIRYGQIGRIRYDSWNDKFPWIALSGEPNKWYKLSSSYDLETAWGKTMLAIALTAFTTGSRVEVECKKGDIHKITMGDDR